MLNRASYSLVTKSSSSLAPISNERGQISIFFSASLVVLITVVAFVINIGLFVKAKINLQNATDASAFAGAAVQARQLTTIGYLNWEMRNIYKEWMYKYYVVGNLNIEDVENPSAISGTAVSYRLRPTTNPLEPDPNRRVMVDQYNFPSVCIHLAGSQTNLCKRYSVPGLPEFGSSGLPGAEQASRAFINTLIGTKVLDCVDQTRLNMLVNLTWAYNVFLDGTETIVQQGPQILADKMGAWPKAVEVAMRIRNLERAVNREPMTGGVCAATPESGKITCRRTITSILSDRALGNERVVKAFFSGYRNLGNEIENEMKQSFTLTELAPKAPELGGPRSASYLLVPADKAQNYKKNYLDLHLQMVNLATFYNAFIPRASTNPGAGDTDIKGTSGACDVSKVAMPVPGYPMGFYKNPDVVTYYAVKGESEFVGMFNPFSDGVVKLTAYAAAKPFGGRIGPMLYFQPPNQEYYQGRTDPVKKRSVPYIASLEFAGTPHPLTRVPINLGDFAPGIPLPINFPNSYFWLKTPTSPLGGYIAGNDVQFGLPNLVYDYQTPFTNTGYTDASADINVITTATPESGDKPIGLFSKFQLQQFKGTALNNTAVSQDLLNQEIKRIKAPTLYETANYLVPSPEDLNKTLKLDSVGFIPGPKTDVNGLDNYQAAIYAPLYSQDQTDVFWTNGNEVVLTVFEFLRAQRSGIDKYKKSMVRAAIAINQMGKAPNLSSDASGAAAGFTRAAKGVADVLDLDNITNVDQQIQSCESLAGVFLYYYYGDQALDPGIVAQAGGCPQTLGVNLRSYFGSNNPATGFSATHYQMDYTYNKNMQRAPNALFSAYMPGPYTGIGANGVFSTPFAGSDVEDETMRRNFYSTKFVQLRSLSGSGPWSENTSNFVMYSEGALATSPGFNRSQKQYANPLDVQALGIDVNAIRY